MLVREQRVAAYAVCVRSGQILLSRYVEAGEPHWTVPGGGVDHGEDPYDAAVREVAEETGYQVVIERLLGVHSVRRRYPCGAGTEADHHGVRVIYAARVVGGELRHEVGGSTDRAAWIDLDHLGGLPRSDLVDVALELYRTGPATGSLR